MAENPASTPTPPSSVAQPYLAGEKPRKRGDGRGYILALACLQAVAALVYFAMAGDAKPRHEAIATLVVMMALAAVFFGLWLWSKKAPFAALLTTLIVFVTFHLVDAVIDPLSLLRGILIKIVILTGLITALKKAYVAKRERELESASS